MKIVDKKILAKTADATIVKLEVEAPHIALKARPGQFVALMADEKGERIPLTIVEANKSSGTISLIFQVLGFTTELLAKKNAKDSLYAITGPLGNATEIKKYGGIILIGGGVGIAEIYPVAKALKEAGNHLTIILGCRSKSILILENELKALSDDFFVTTDDGSYGRKGFVTDVLQELLDKRRPYNLVYAVGPIPMMKRVSEVAKPFNVKTTVSLNAIMVDATGMCGCCRVTVGGEVMFSCVDGPEFDAESIDWDELTKRNRIYTDKEKHICKLKP